MKIKSCPHEIWEVLSNDVGSSTFFQSPHWYNMWQKINAFAIETMLFEENGESAILPLYSLRQGLLRRKVFSSSPEGCYGGLIYKPDNSTKFIESVKNELHRKDRLYIRSNPFINDQNNYLHNVTQESCYVLELDGVNTFTTDNWTAKHRQSLSIANKHKLKVSATEDISDWKHYQKLYKEQRLLRENASNNYGSQLFHAIYKLPDSFRKLFVVANADSIICGGLFFMYNNKMHYWHGASTAEGKASCASFKLIEHAIKFTIKNAYKYFDFMPSGGNAGVEHFKKGFGTSKFSCNIQFN